MKSFPDFKYTIHTTKPTGMNFMGMRNAMGLVYQFIARHYTI